MKLSEAMRETLKEFQQLRVHITREEIREVLMILAEDARALMDPRWLLLLLSSLAIAVGSQQLPFQPITWILGLLIIPWVCFWARVFELWDAPYLGKWEGEAEAGT